MYPALAISAALLVFASLASALLLHQRGPQALLWAASAASILHFAATSRAAPLMLGIRDAPNDESALMARLDGFARWHAVRTVLQCLTFLALVAALTG